MEIAKRQFQAATIRGEGERRHGYAVSAEYDARQDRLVVGLNTGVVFMVSVRLLEGLADADAEELAEIEISPAGLGLHRPRLEADIYVPALMHGVFGTKSWMAGLRDATGGH